jgi:hypothetical protein
MALEMVHLLPLKVEYMLAKIHIYWASVTFSKKILTNLMYMVKEKTKLITNVT